MNDVFLNTSLEFESLGFRSLGYNPTRRLGSGRWDSSRWDTFYIPQICSFFEMILLGMTSIARRFGKWGKKIRGKSKR